MYYHYWVPHVQIFGPVSRADAHKRTSLSICKLAKMSPPVALVADGPRDAADMLTGLDQDVLDCRIALQLDGGCQSRRSCSDDDRRTVFHAVIRSLPGDFSINHNVPPQKANEGWDCSQPSFVFARFCRNPAGRITAAARRQPATPWAPSPR